MKEPIQFFVEGDPKGQPRPRACRRGAHAGMYDPGTADAWKMAVAEAWRSKAQPVEPFPGAVFLSLRFYFRRPKSHYGKGGAVKKSAPCFHASKPDIDNSAKAVMDVLTRLNAWRDDSQVASLIVSKVWHELPGCNIEIRETV